MTDSKPAPTRRRYGPSAGLEAAHRVVLGASGYMARTRAGARGARLARARGGAQRRRARGPRVAWRRVPVGRRAAARDARPVLAGADVVFYLVHMMWSGGDFVPVERRAAENARKACEAAGVRRIVYLGGIMPKEQRSRHMRAGRWWRRAARGHGPGHRAAGRDDRRARLRGLEVIRDLVNHLPLMVTRSGCASARRLSRSRTCSSTRSPRRTAVRGPPRPRDRRAGHAHLPGDHEYLRGVRRQEAARHSVPVLTPKLSSYWLHLVTSVPATTAMSLVEDSRTTTSATTGRCARWCRSGCSPSASPWP